MSIGGARGVGKTTILSSIRKYCSKEQRVLLEQEMEWYKTLGLWHGGRINAVTFEHHIYQSYQREVSAIIKQTAGELITTSLLSERSILDLLYVWLVVHSRNQAITMDDFRVNRQTMENNTSYYDLPLVWIILDDSVDELRRKLKERDGEKYHETWSSVTELTLQRGVHAAAAYYVDGSDTHPLLNGIQVVVFNITGLSVEDATRAICFRLHRMGIAMFNEFDPPLCVERDELRERWLRGVDLKQDN